MGDRKEKTETYYYGEAEAPKELIKDYSQLRLTKGSSLDEILAGFTWKARFNKLMESLWF